MVSDGVPMRGSRDEAVEALSPLRLRILRVLARASFVLAAVLVLVAASAHLAGVRLNYTRSLPRGLYLESDFNPSAVQRGDLVAACPEENAGRAVAEYLPPGSCPGGVIELAKYLAALPGDTVLVDSAGVWVGGDLLPNSAPLFHDRRGRALAPHLGQHVLGRGQYWLFSNRVATSVDSRYVGPTADVRFALRPLLVED